MASIRPSRIINYRPMVEIAVGFILGIAACGALPYDSIFILGIALIILASLLFCLGKRRTAIFLFAILIGTVLAFVNEPPKIQKGEYRITGVVTDISQEEGTELTLSSVELNGTAVRKKLLLITKNEDDNEEGGINFSIGDRISVNAYAKNPDLKFDTYDEYKYCLSIGIGIKAYADNQSDIRLISHNNARFTQTLHSLRQTIINKTTEIFENDGELLAALLMGERRELPESRRDVYQVTGTAHLLAISGFHMGVIVSFIGLLFPKRKRYLRAVFIGLCMLAYCSITVYAPGLVRSAIMTFAMLLCFGMERRHDSLSALALAAVLILLFEPFQLYSIGFQLSFSACLGIILLNKPIKSGLEKLHIPFASMIAVTLSATLATMMFQMRYFGTFSLYSLIGNMIAVPAFSAVLLSGIILTALGFIIPGAAAFLANAPRFVLFAVEQVLGFLSKLPFAVIEFKAPSLLSCTLFLLMLFAASEYILRSPEKRIKYAFAMLLLFTLSIIISIIPA